ncbi:hypothetical protein H2248_001864 [Termitomyces sp. 'cryptogamus']|nr:hypothetical protein H2248_001864 [Termitomyces sp. 'cryptogamus']
MLSSNERSYFIIGGFSLLWNIAGLTASALCYGVGSGLYIMYLLTFVQKDAKTCIAWIMFIAVSVAFVLATSYVALYFTILKDAVDVGMITISDPVNDETLESVKLGQKTIKLISIWASQLIVIINDMTIVWRAWVVSIDQRWLAIGPFVSFFATCVVSFVIVGLIVTNPTVVVTNNTDAVIAWGPEITFYLSSATNVLSTFMVCYQLWRYRTSLWRRRHWTLGQKVLLVVVESGIVLLIFQLMAAATATIPPLPTAGSYFSKGLYEASIQIMAMYPAAVLSLIQEKRSLDELQISIMQRTTSL